MYIQITADEKDDKFINHLREDRWYEGATSADRPPLSLYYSMFDLEAEDISRVLKVTPQGIELLPLNRFVGANPKLIMSADGLTGKFQVRGIKYEVSLSHVTRSFGYSVNLDNLCLGETISHYLCTKLDLPKQLDLIGSFISDATFMELETYLNTGSMSGIFENRPIEFINYMVNEIYGVGKFTGLLTNYASARIAQANAINKFYTI